MAAGRSLPGWAVGLAIFSSFVSGISFIANPGSSFQSNWRPFVFSLALPFAALFSARFFVPFYRQSGHVSAYEHLEHRFGLWARTYGSVCYLLLQLVRTGTVIYLLTLAIAPLFSETRDSATLRTIILVLGLIMTLYPLLGGTEAVIWTGALQSIVLLIGALVSAGYLLFNSPGGPSRLFSFAANHHKFSLGESSLSLLRPTILVVFLYVICENLRNFGVTQTYIQSYITARSDAAAKRSIYLAAALYIPLSAVFFFIGTALFTFYSSSHATLPAGIKPDDVFPHFIHNHLPAGVRGLILAAICAAATDSNFNSTSTLFLRDLYQRYLRPKPSERESMWVLRAATLLSGIVSTAVAFLMTRSQAALDAWWVIAGILTGSLLGLFLLGRFTRRPRSSDAAIALLASTAVVLWMTASLPAFARAFPGFNLPPLPRSPFDGLMIPVFATATVLLIGGLLSIRHASSPTPTS
jgi:SSS family solute:Na+ symporter